MESTENKDPRITNRGVVNTEVSQNVNGSPNPLLDYAEKGSLKCLIDWFQFTIPITVEFDQVFSMIGIPKSEFVLMESEKKILGYSIAYRMGHIVVLTGGTPQMGHHVQMSGQGCRELELYNGENRWQDIMRKILAARGKFSRLDVAVDDFKGYFHIPDLVEKIKDGELVSRFKKAKRIEDILIKDGSTLGNTLYYGRASSDIQIRMYEKNYQQEMQDTVDVWNRTEIQMRDVRASMFAEYYALHDRKIGELATGVISNYLTFKDKDENDSNKSRWEISQFWIDFINDVEKISLTVKKPDRSMQKIKNWLSNQTSKSLAMLTMLEPHELNEIIKEGQQKITQKDENIMELYLQEKELLLSKLEIKKQIKKELLLMKKS